MLCVTAVACLISRVYVFDQTCLSFSSMKCTGISLRSLSFQHLEPWACHCWCDTVVITMGDSVIVVLGYHRLCKQCVFCFASCIILLCVSCCVHAELSLCVRHPEARTGLFDSFIMSSKSIAPPSLQLEWSDYNIYNVGFIKWCYVFSFLFYFWVWYNVMEDVWVLWRPRSYSHG